MPKYVVKFSEIDKNDFPLVGEKGVTLGEMATAGFPVPNGFVVTSQAYYDFIRENKLEVKIHHLLSTVNFNNEKSLDQAARYIKKYIKEGKFSQKLIKEIISAYNQLGKGSFAKDPVVAVKPSAITGSFGDQSGYLNVKGDAVLLEKIKQAWAAFFDAEAILYRHEQKIDHVRLGIALVIQKMVEADASASGVMFTIDPLTNDKSKLVIEAIYGLGELLVQGKETPDLYEVKKLNQLILTKKTALQKKMLKKVEDAQRQVKLSKKVGQRQKISDQQIKELAKLGEKIEKHYYFPQEIEWTIENEQIYIIQVRPVTATASIATSNDGQKIPGSDIILKGNPISPGIASGPVRIIFSAKEIGQVMPEDVLVLQEIIPDFMPAMKKAAAIISDNCDRSSYTTTVAKKLGIPIVVGTKTATGALRTGNVVTVNGSKGEIYKGGFAIRQTAYTEKSAGIKTATKLYVDLASPDLAEKAALTNADGVGIFRAESIIADIGVHPKKMIRDGKKQDYINLLASNIAVVCRFFNDRPVVYRSSNFKTNEYRNLLGGKDFEPQEVNPNLGFRGAFRYLHDPEIFKLELEAIKTVRDKMGYRNLWLMVPFVRTVEELIEVKKIINENGLERSANFKLWMMVEIPSNLIMLEKFIEVGIDGVSINADELTMLIMGTDRNNFELANEFNEMHPAVLWAFEHIIKIANKNDITSSFCGQTSALYPELVKNVVTWGITSLSVSPDAIGNTRKLLAQTEKELLNCK